MAAAAVLTPMQGWPSSSLSVQVSFRSQPLALRLPARLPAGARPRCRGNGTSKPKGSGTPSKQQISSSRASVAAPSSGSKSLLKLLGFGRGGDGGDEDDEGRRGRRHGPPLSLPPAPSPLSEPGVLRLQIRRARGPVAAQCFNCECAYSVTAEVHAAPSAAARAALASALSHAAQAYTQAMTGIGAAAALLTQTAEGAVGPVCDDLADAHRAAVAALQRDGWRRVRASQAPTARATDAGAMREIAWPDDAAAVGAAVLSLPVGPLDVVVLRANPIGAVTPPPSAGMIASPFVAVLLPEWIVGSGDAGPATPAPAGDASIIATAGSGSATSSAAPGGLPSAFPVSSSSSSASAAGEAERQRAASESAVVPPGAAAAAALIAAAARSRDTAGGRAASLPSSASGSRSPASGPAATGGPAFVEPIAWHLMAAASVTSLPAGFPHSQLLIDARVTVGTAAATSAPATAAAGTTATTTAAVSPSGVPPMLALPGSTSAATSPAGVAVGLAATTATPSNECVPTLALSSGSPAASPAADAAAHAPAPAAGSAVSPAVAAEVPPPDSGTLQKPRPPPGRKVGANGGDASTATSAATSAGGSAFGGAGAGAGGAAASPAPVIAAAATVAAAPVALVEAPSEDAAIAIAPLPHKHTVYCDRKRQVCTAGGAVREGNVLALTAPHLGLALDTPASAAAATAGIGVAADASSASDDAVAAAAGGIAGEWRVQWCRSTHRAPAFASFERQLAHMRAEGVAGQHSTIVGDGSDGCAAASAAATSGSAFAVSSGVTLAPLPPRSASSTFPLPPAPALRAALPPAQLAADASCPAAVVGEFEAMYAAALSAHDGFPSDSSPLYSGAAALRLMRAEALAAAAHPLRLFLTLDDVGHCFVAVLTHSRSGAVVRSPVVGPVEAAPPRVRELWLEGTPACGNALLARSWYFGGVPGACDYSWIRVDAEGNRTETDIVAQQPLDPLPASGAAAAVSAGADVRVRHLGGEDVGCMFKVTVDPMRWDGVRGAPTTSKPSAEVEPHPLTHTRPSEGHISFAPEHARNHGSSRF